MASLTIVRAETATDKLVIHQRLPYHLDSPGHYWRQTNVSHVSPTTPPPPFLISARPLRERPQPIREHALWEFNKKKRKRRSRGEQRRAEGCFSPVVLPSAASSGQKTRGRTGVRTSTPTWSCSHVLFFFYSFLGDKSYFIESCGAELFSRNLSQKKQKNKDYAGNPRRNEAAEGVHGSPETPPRRHDA